MKIIKLTCLLLILFVLPQSFALAYENAKVRGVTIQLQEIANDGTFDIFQENRFRKVDANSILKLNFVVPPPPDKIQFTPAWESLSLILDSLSQLSQKYKSLTERGRILLRTNAPHDISFTKNVDLVMAQAVKILQLFVNPPAGEPILSPQELSALMIQRKDDPYTALAQVLTAKQNQLHEDAVKFAEDADKYEVLVRAFRIPLGGQRQALHVPGYDNLPQGDFRPTNPLAVLPSQAEFNRIIGELEASKHVQSAIQEIRKNGLAIKENMTRLIEDFNGAVRKLDKNIHSEIIRRLPKNWEVLTADSFLTQISQLEIPESNAPTILRDELIELRKDVENLKEIKHLFSKIKECSANLTKSSGVSFPGIKSILKNISPLSKKIQHSFKRLKHWKERFARIGSAVPVVTAHVTGQSMKKNLATINSDIVAGLKNSQERIETELPKTIHAFSILQDISKNQNMVDLGSSLISVGANAPEYIPHPLEDLEPAELDLRYSGIVVGDHISITVDIQSIESDTSKTRLNPPAVVYNMETTFAGWHRKYQSSIVFSQTRQGPKSEAFQSNFALALEWHHYDRFSPNSFLNKLDFAFGLHAAFLEHDADENFEMGGGVNISVLQGLIRAGYGYNISTKENNEYWFVGFGLFSMLGQIRDLGNEIVGK